MSALIADMLIGINVCPSPIQVALMATMPWDKIEESQTEPLLSRKLLNVRLASLADIGQSIGDVRFAPESGHVQRPIADIANEQSGRGTSHAPYSSRFQLVVMGRR